MPPAKTAAGRKGTTRASRASRVKTKAFVETEEELSDDNNIQPDEASSDVEVVSEAEQEEPVKSRTGRLIKSTPKARAAAKAKKEHATAPKNRVVEEVSDAEISQTEQEEHADDSGGEDPEEEITLYSEDEQEEDVEPETKPKPKPKPKPKKVSIKEPSSVGKISADGKPQHASGQVTTVPSRRTKNVVKKEEDVLSGSPAVTSRGRESPPWPDSLLESPKKGRGRKAEDVATPPSPSPKKTPSKKRVFTSMESPSEDFEMGSPRAASPTKKARHAVPSPPSTPPHQIKKLSFDVEDDDDNPFIDKAASDVQEDDNTAYKTTTLRNVIGEIEECAVSGPTALEDYGGDLDTLLSEWYIRLPKLEEVKTSDREGQNQIGHMQIEREMCDFGFTDPLHHARIARAFAVDNIGGARNAVTVAPRDLEVIERNMVAFKGNKSPAAFITFGAVHESHIVEVETRHSGKVQKGVRLFPGAVETARIGSTFGTVRKAGYLGMPSWNGALQFSTKQESAEKKDWFDDGDKKGSSRMPSKYQSTPRKSRVARSAMVDGVPSFFDDFLTQVAKRGILSSTEKITVFDLREWYQGDKMDEKPVFSKILATAPLLVDEEIPTESFVGVLYTAGFWVRDKGEVNLNLNILGIVLLLSRPSDYVQSKNHPSKKKSKA